MAYKASVSVQSLPIKENKKTIYFLPFAKNISKSHPAKQKVPLFFLHSNQPKPITEQNKHPTAKPR